MGELIVIIGALWGILAWVLGPDAQAPKPTPHVLKFPPPREEDQVLVPPLLQAARTQAVSPVCVLPGLERRDQESLIAYSNRLKAHLGASLTYAEMDRLVKRMQDDAQ